MSKEDSSISDSVLLFHLIGTPYFPKDIIQRDKPLTTSQRSHAEINLKQSRVEQSKFTSGNLPATLAELIAQVDPGANNSHILRQGRKRRKSTKKTDSQDTTAKPKSNRVAKIDPKSWF